MKKMSTALTKNNRHKYNDIEELFKLESSNSFEFYLDIGIFVSFDILIFTQHVL